MNMKIVLAIIVAIIITLVAVYLIDVDVDGEVELPSVSADINAEGGNMPNVDVNAADVNVREEQGTVDVPADVQVETQEEEFTYPTIDFEAPEEDSAVQEENVDTIEPSERNTN